MSEEEDMVEIEIGVDGYMMAEGRAIEEMKNGMSAKWKETLETEMSGDFKFTVRGTALEVNIFLERLNEKINSLQNIQSGISEKLEEENAVVDIDPLTSQP